MNRKNHFSLNPVHLLPFFLILLLPTFILSLNKSTDQRGKAAGDFAPYPCQPNDPPAKLAFLNNVKGMLKPGEATTFYLTIANCSTETWSKGANFKLGTQAPENNQTWGTGRFELPTDLPPRSQVQVALPVKAPQAPGAYPFQIGVLQEGRRWIKPYLPPTIVMVGTSKRCAGLRNVRNTDQDAQPILQRCIDGAQTGEIIVIPKGKYQLAKQVKISKTVSLVTEGYELTQHQTCLSSGGTECARFVAGSTYPINPKAGNSFDYTMIRIDGPGGVPVERVGIKNIIFDGNRLDRQKEPCIKANTCVTMSMIGNHSLLFGNAFIDGVSWTAMEMRGDHNTLAFNFVANNGVKMAQTLPQNQALPMTWSDGFSLINVKNVTVMNNHFLDNTDVDLILWGARNANVSLNTIEHQDRNHEAFMALALESQTSDFPDFADFTEAHITHNTIRCNNLCGIGISVGTKPYRQDYTPIFGAQIRNNTIDKAMQGILVEEGGTTQSPVILENNSVTRSGGITTGCGFTTGSFNISPYSKVHIADGMRQDSSISWNDKVRQNNPQTCKLPSCIWGEQYCVQ